MKPSTEESAARPGPVSPRSKSDWPGPIGSAFPCLMRMSFLIMRAASRLGASAPSILSKPGAARPRESRAARGRRPTVHVEHQISASGVG